MSALDILHLTTPEWMTRAACREEDPALFFPAQGAGGRRAKGANVAAAKAVCARCSVSTPCLEFALSLPREGGFPTWGVWGGTSAADRASMRRAAS